MNEGLGKFSIKRIKELDKDGNIERRSEVLGSSWKGLNMILKLGKC